MNNEHFEMMKAMTAQSDEVFFIYDINQACFNYVNEHSNI